MDSMVIEALADARDALTGLRGVAEAKALRKRREAIACAAARLDLLTSPPDHVVRIALLALEVRDAARALRSSHLVLTEALREAMD